MLSITIFCDDYPTKVDPSFAFIRPLVTSLADLGCLCSVIVPQSIAKSIVRKKSRRPIYWEDRTKLGNIVKIYQPNYISFSNFKIHGISLSAVSRLWTIKRFAKKYNIKSDLFYAHFWHNGIVAASVNAGVPVVVASGESVIGVKRGFPEALIESRLRCIKGVVAVSSKNLKESESLNLLKFHPFTSVLPNSYSPDEFYVESKLVCRKSLRFNNEDFIISFVGSFDERKGVNRLIEAAKFLPNIKLILVGSGNQVNESQQVVFKGRIPHDKIVDYLNASDVFVLPTRAEGCCNAIIEAMACGLPIISSNLSFNDDILNNENSIRINPESIDEIASAIKKLYENPALREKMSAAALKTASNLTIDKRANAILNFMEMCRKK